MSGTALDVLGEQPRVVHLVDMVAGEDQHVLRRVAAQDVEVLVHGVRRFPLIPVERDALLRRQQLDELVETAVEKAPARAARGGSGSAPCTACRCRHGARRC
jgi:hypothetical protein